MAQTLMSSRDARRAAFIALLDFLSSRPLDKPLIPIAPDAHQRDSLLTGALLQDLTVSDPNAPSHSPESTDTSVDHDYRAKIILTYLVQSLDHLIHLIRVLDMPCNELIPIKNALLESHDYALMTRSQRTWFSPYTNLSVYMIGNGAPLVHFGVVEARGEFDQWYEERQEKGEVGKMIERVCRVIEGVEGVCDGSVGRPRL